MDSDRINQLKRQRDLILEHLDWLNGEIDRAAVLSPGVTTSPKASRLAEAFAVDKPVEMALSDRDIESTPTSVAAAELYGELGPDTKGAAAAAKRGCFALCGLAFAALAGLLVAIYAYY